MPRALSARSAKKLILEDLVSYIESGLSESVYENEDGEPLSIKDRETIIKQARVLVSEFVRRSG